MKHSLINGVEDTTPLAHDPGLTRGMNVFESLRTYGTTPFRLKEHLERLEISARAMRIPMPAPEILAAEVLSLCERDVWIRITLTRGGNRVVHSGPMNPKTPRKRMRVASTPATQTPWLPGYVKHGSRALWVRAAEHMGVDEVVFVEDDGLILEANRSNVIVVQDGVLKTPPLNGRFLEGVTRGALLEAAQRAGLAFVEAPVHLNDSMDECYLASSFKELSPVISFDGREMSPGPYGDALYKAFRDLVAEECGA